MRYLRMCTHGIFAYMYLMCSGKTTFWSESEVICIHHLFAKALQPTRGFHQGSDGV